MWASVDIEIIRSVNSDAIATFENADAEDGILLNHVYVDMRGYTLADARDIVAEEAALLRDIEAMGYDADLDGVSNELYESCSELSAFDIGVAGTIFALSAAGAAPISSCNGGLLGDGDHSSEVPHVLFSIGEGRLQPILTAAEAVNVGLLNNSGHIEVFADTIPKLNAFAERLLLELANHP